MSTHNRSKYAPPQKDNAPSTVQDPLAAVPAYLSEHYTVIDKIGEGTYGVVYMAKTKDQHPRMLAIKTFKPGKEGDGISPTAIREIMLLRELKHDNIVHLDAVHLHRPEPSLSLAFDYAEHDLYEMLRFHRERGMGPVLETYTLKSLMWQLLDGLQYLHSNWVMHRDLKPSNILVVGEGEEQGRVKIGDFGLARIYACPLRPLSDNGVVVTIWYRAPELLLGARHYTPAADVWAAGCILAEMLALRPLFQGNERKTPASAFQADQCDKIFRVLGLPSAASWPALEYLPHWRDNTENVRAHKPEFPAKSRLAEVIAEYSALAAGGGANPSDQRGGALSDLLSSMLAYNPEHRISAADALQHPYFQEEPRPGRNAFIHNGRLLVQYPRRSKHGPAGASMPPGAPLNTFDAPQARLGPSRNATPTAVLGPDRRLTPVNAAVTTHTTPQGLPPGSASRPRPPLKRPHQDPWLR
ncbi:Cyclin-dependent kinase E-1 [Coccomyxa sp. Obi]|nr:Cyclin-dependent kinase E-1 [Coccomyxa sp. Obi]